MLASLNEEKYPKLRTNSFLKLSPIFPISGLSNVAQETTTLSMSKLWVRKKFLPLGRGPLEWVQRTQLQGQFSKDHICTCRFSKNLQKKNENWTVFEMIRVIR